MEGFLSYPLIDAPVKLIKEKKCPIFKRKSFFQEYNSYLSSSSGDQASKLLNFLKDNSSYDVDMIWENILRTCHIEDIKNCLNLNYILPKYYTQAKSVKKRIALVIHSYFEDLIDDCYEYALSMPEYSDIYVTVSTERQKNLVERRFEKKHFNSVKVVMIENRGRDIGALLVGVAKYLKDYEYVCFTHDKKVRQLDWGIKGYAFSERCFQNVLGSKEYVNNILELFERETRLGVLCPPPPNHADFYCTASNIWGPNYENAKRLAEALHLNVPLSENKNPVTPIGGVFWFRYAALKDLLEYDWKYTDFPPEPSGFDGTILHAVERIFPFVAQNAGYYTAWVMTDEFMRTEWNNLSYMLFTLTAELVEAFGPDAHYGMLQTIKNYQNSRNIKMIGIYTRFKYAAKRRMPQKLWNVLRKIYRKILRKQ